jgi:serine/threonine protein kinase
VSNQPEWLIMEWFENDLQSTAVHLQDISSLLLHIARGLAFMHLQKFAHRDLKPANILLHMDGERLVAAKIADFGTTKQ